MAKRKGQGKRHHRGGHTHRIHNPDWKILLFAGAVGTVGIIGAAYLQGKIAFLSQYWYALPLLYVGAGALLLKRMPLVGVGLGAMAGALAYTSYYTFGPGSGSKPATPAAGFGSQDTGSFGVKRDAGMYDRPQGVQAALPGYQHGAGAALPGVSRGAAAGFSAQDTGFLAGLD